MKLSYRILCFYLTLFCIFLISVALILEYAFGLNPCSLCMVDRFLVIGLFIVFVLAWLHNPSKTLTRRIYSGLALLFSCVGVFVSARHIWIIHYPDENLPSCAPGFDYLISTLPLNEAVLTMLSGSKDCTQGISYFFGLSLPAWTLIGFVMMLLGCIMFWRRSKA